MKKFPALLLAASLAFSFFAHTTHAMTPDDRTAYLRWMQQSLPDVPEWTAWQKNTAALPPDFDALPRTNLLPDPLRFLDGRNVSNTADWPARRAEILALFKKYVTGKFPPKPTITRVELLDETLADNCTTRNVRIHFGPDGKASVRVRIVIPDNAAKSSTKLPALICPNLAGWSQLLARRGYISVGYAGNDRMDDAAQLRDLYPDYDFATLPRRAWLAQVVLDYLETVPQIDMNRVAIFGYSRDGKMAALAAALDTRISALIAGSTGVGGLLPWRYAGERGGGEGIETTTRMFPDWFAPQLRFFSGREDRLPVDANLLIALIAPRAVLSEWGNNDQVANGWAIEQAHASAQKVYDLLNAPADRLGLLHVPGFHGSNDPDACIDWLDTQFNRSQNKWPDNRVFPWNFEKWLAQTDTKIPALSNTRAAIDWMLGDAPPLLSPPADASPFPRRAPPPGPTAVAQGNIGNPGQLAPDVPAWVIAAGSQEYGWLEPEKNQVTSCRIRFGENITGDLYYPANTPAGAKLPTVIWLHGYHYPLGYMWVYRRDLHPILALTRAGFAVLAYDQSGFGTRYAEAAPFYDRYPRWSRLGKMVEDVRAAVTALETDDLVDSKKISLYGYTLGGTIALHAAALDKRIHSVVSICGFTPMRTDTPDRGTTGATRLSHLYGLLPRLGLYAGNEKNIPYDYDDLLAQISPRPILIVQPQRDRDATPADVRAAVEQARKKSTIPANLSLFEPDDYARLTTATQDAAIEWMKQNTKHE